MKTMKVVMYYNNNDVRIEQQPVPDIGDDELLVKVKASGICGSDVMEWYRVKKAPLVLGHELTGDIVKTGKKVTEFKVGDRIVVTHHVPCNTCSFCKNDQHTLCDTLHTTKFYPGGFAEYLRVPAINVDRGTFVLPKEISYEAGTFVEPLACVVRGLRIAQMKKGKSVLVLGSGMAGLLNIKLTRALGASKVFATDVNPYRLEMAKNAGADVIINATDNVAKKIQQENMGQLADLVILCAGVPSAVQQAFESVQPGGTILFFAMTKPGETIPLHLFNVWNKQITMVSTYAGAPRDLKEAIGLLQTKKISVTDMITHVLPLDEAATGFKLVDQAQDSMKVILKP